MVTHIFALEILVYNSLIVYNIVMYCNIFTTMEINVDEKNTFVFFNKIAGTYYC